MNFKVEVIDWYRVKMMTQRLYGGFVHDLLSSINSALSRQRDSYHGRKFKMADNSKKFHRPFAHNRHLGRRPIWDRQPGYINTVN